LICGGTAPLVFLPTFLTFCYPNLSSCEKGAKENFELALEIDNDNTHARYWLGKMHFKYHVPGACKAV